MYKDFSSSEAKLLLFASILVSGLAFFETTAVNVAITSIQKYFDANISLMQWAINSYNLMLGIFILIMGSLSDRFGRKKLLVAGVLIFTVGSALCGIATDIWFMIIARIIQGLGGAMMIPQSIAIINTSFEERIRGQAIGLWGAMSGLLTIMGPFVGGAIVDLGGWRWTFLILVPFGLVGMYLIHRIVPETGIIKKAKVDWLSVGLLGTGLSMLSYGLIQASSQAWEDPIIDASIIVGLIVIGVFFWWQTQSKNPLIDLKVLGRRNVFLANLFTIFLYAVISAVAFYAVIFFQQVAEYSATMSGLAIMPVSVIIAGLSIFSGGIADKYGARIPLVLGAVFVAVGMLFLLNVSVDALYWTEIFPGMLLVGLGFGIFIPSLTKTALDVPPEYSGTASGINNSVSRVAGLLGIAILGAVITSVFHHTLKKDVLALSLPPQTQQEIISQSTKLMQIEIPSLPAEDTQTIKDLMKKSFLRAYKFQLIACAVLALLGAMSAWMMKRKG